MANQYEVLGKAPGLEELNKLSPSDVHLTIRGLSAGYGKMEILHNFDLTVSKAQSLCLIGPNGAGKSTILHSIYGFTNIFDGKIEIEGVAESNNRVSSLMRRLEASDWLQSPNLDGVAAAPSYGDQATTFKLTVSVQLPEQEEEL